MSRDLGDVEKKFTELVVENILAARGINFRKPDKEKEEKIKFIDAYCETIGLMCKSLLYFSPEDIALLKRGNLLETAVIAIMEKLEETMSIVEKINQES